MSLNLKKVLVADAVDQSCIELLKKHGFDVDNRTKLSKDVLLKEIKNYDGLIVRSQTKVTADVIEAASSLKVIGRAGTGVDNIDVNAATKKGIIVLNTPGGNSISACELTCALILSLARNVAQGCASLKAGRWDRALYSGTELSGKTLAVIGLGRIGREVASRMQAFGMKTIGFDPIVSRDDCNAINIEKFDNIDDIFPHADYITVHTPLIPQTRNLINRKTLSLCKQGVKIINVARGGIVDEEALLESLKTGYCGGAGIDVFYEEPPKSPVSLELIAHPKVVVTPHLGASTSEAQTRVAVEVAEQFVALKNPKSEYSLTGVVNAPILSSSQNEANVPWIELAKILGEYAVKLSGLTDLSTAVVDVTSYGNELKPMHFLSTSVSLGMLSGRTKNGLNLISAPSLAKEVGISVSLTNESSPDKGISVAINTSEEQFTVSGTICGNKPVITQINDAAFNPAVPVNSDVIFFRGTNINEDFQKIYNEVQSRSLNITNVLFTTSPKYVWFAVQISNKDGAKSLKPIKGIKTF